MAFALITSIAYASREKLKEGARNWLAGRVQSLFAQRSARYRLPRRGRRLSSVIAHAKESFSQRSIERPDPLAPQSEGTVRVNVLRFSHRGRMSSSAAVDAPRASHIRLFFRYDLSPLFLRLHDAVTGFAMPDPDGRRIVVTDVPRTYRLPLYTALRIGARTTSRRGYLVLSKNGLLRFEEQA